MATWLRARTPEEWITAILMTLVVALLGWQVFFRFAFGQTISWLEEVTRFAFVWAVYFGFIVAAEKDRHIRVVGHFMWMSERGQKVMLTLADFIWLVFNAVVIYYGSQFVYSMIQFPYRSQTTGINLMWVYLIVPLGFLLMSVRVVHVMIHRWRTHDVVHDTRLDA